MLLPIVAWGALTAATVPGSVDTDVSGLRSGKGQVLACLTTRPDSFPDCQSDPQARHLTIAAASLRDFRFGDLPSGRYAIALIHDENGNNKLDTVLGIPREGFGFSRNPIVRFGAPSFRAAQFDVGSGSVDEPIRVRYLF